MSNGLCMNCFRVKGKYTVCRYCGYIEGTPPEQDYYLCPGTMLEEEYKETDKRQGRYLIGTVIGSGGFGITYKAYDKVLGMVVAIKECFPSGLASRMPGEKEVLDLSGGTGKNMEWYMDMLHAETEKAQQVKSSGVIKVYNYFKENNTAYMVMEYVEGVSLEEYIGKYGARNRLSAGEAINFIMQIIDAMAEIHAEHVIHGDISPDNIFITRDKKIKLLDFGTASDLENDGQGTEKAVIKAGYTAPEIYNKSEKGFYTDVYSVGAVFYRMLTGEKPQEASGRIQKDRLYSPLRLGKELTGDSDTDIRLDKAVMMALAVKIKYRFGTMEEFKAAINGRLAYDYQKQLDYPASMEKKIKRKRNLATAACIAAMSILCLGIVGFFWIGTNRKNLSGVELEKGSITVWIPIRKGTDASAEQEAMKDIVKMFHEDENYPDNKKIKVDIATVSEEKYAQAYREALQKEEQPDLYCLDYMKKGYEEETAKLDRLYNSLELSDYYFLEEYKNLFEEKQAIPLSFQSLFLTAGVKALARDGQGVYYTQRDKEAGERTMEITEVLTAEEKGQSLIFADNTILPVLFLADSDWKSSTSMNTGKIFIANLTKINLLQKTALQQKAARENGKEPITKVQAAMQNGNALVGNGQDVNTLKNLSYPDEPSTYLLVHQEKPVWMLSDCYAVSAAAEKNEQYACMRLLQYMLSGRGQERRYINTRRAFPLHKEMFRKYMQYENGYYSGMKRALQLQDEEGYENLITPEKSEFFSYETERIVPRIIENGEIQTAEQIESEINQ